MKTLRKLFPFLLLMAGSLTANLAHAQYGSDFTCDNNSEGLAWFNYTDSLYKYCPASGAPLVLAERAWVTTNFSGVKPSATGSLTNSALGCTSTTVTLTGAAVGNAVNVAFTGSSAIPAGLVPSAQITAPNTATVNVCAVITLSIASRPFIVNLL